MSAYRPRHELDPPAGEVYAGLDQPSATPEGPATPLCGPVAAATGAARETAVREAVDRISSYRRATIRQMGRWSWQGKITVGLMGGYVHAMTRKRCEAKVRRELQRIAKRDAWKDAEVVVFEAP